MRRRIARAVFVLLVGVLATALGVATALLFTPTGRTLVARLITEEAPRLVRGSVQIGAVRGSWEDGFTLERVVIRDTAGQLLASVPRLEVQYALRTLLSGRFILTSLRLEQPEIQILKHRSGRVNYEEIFRLGEGPPGTSPRLIEVRHMTITGGYLTIRLPWNPDGRLRGARQIDSALAYERSKTGRRIEAGPEGLDLIRTIDSLDAYLPLLRISSPDRQPLTLEIGRLAARVSDPALRIRELKGGLRTKNDSLVFNVEHLALPGTTGSGAGRLDWPRDTIMYRFGFQIPRLALADLRWISPRFPDYTGSARVQARSSSGARTEFDIRDLGVGDPESRVSGRLVAITDVYRGLGFRGLNLSLANVDLDVMRAYLDTLPFYGRLTGRLEADGFFDDMSVSLDWRFSDAHVPGGSETQLALDGRLRLGGADGIFFEDARVPQSDVDLRTVRLVAPAMILDGRLALAGTLAGPWKNAVFEGSGEHRDGDRPASRFNGRVRLDTRGQVLGVETDVVLDSLVFEGIRRSFPRLTSKGALGGRVRLSGDLDRLAVDADVGGRLGHVQARGWATLLAPRWGADSLQLGFERLDLGELLENAPPSRLQGVLRVSGVADSAQAPVGHLEMTLGSSRIREFVLDSGTARLRVADSVLVVDTVRVHWGAGRLDGGGTLGWAPPRTGHVAFHAEAGDLAPFDSLALALSGLTRDTASMGVALRGSGRGDLTLEGALGALRIAGTATVDSARWLRYRGMNLRGHLVLATADSALDVALSADSVWVRQFLFAGLSGQAKGHTGSFQWVASGSSSGLARVDGAGRFERKPAAKLFHADRLDLDLLGRPWGLAAPVDVLIGNSVIALDTVRLLTRDGSGAVELAGDIPRRGSGALSFTALGVELRDLYGLLQRDTAGIQGTLIVDARLGGTARAPEIRGTGALTGGVFGDFEAPLIRSAFDYRERLLRSNLTFWRTGKPFLQVDASLPLDLALERVEPRQLPGPLTILARGDSIDLALAEAFTPNLRRMGGQLDLDVRVEGTWDQPRLAGQARLANGAASIPALGVRYHNIGGTLRFAGDSIQAQGLRVESHSGEMSVGGGIRLQRLTLPVLGLVLTAKDFQLIDVSDYMSLRSRGTVELTGTLSNPVLTGAGRLDNSVIYFADLIQKEVVNLEDPLTADLVDTLALRKFSLGANFQSRFLDSLTIRDLEFEIGQDVWLRSNEANFQLEGRVRVNKSPARASVGRRAYQLAGTLDTPRGNYTLKLGGFVNRTFTVEQGTVQYFGDLNARMDVRARHVVRTPGRGIEDTPVIAHITGTLEVPKLSLTTPPDRPPMSEPELISLLMFGTPNPASVSQFGTGGGGQQSLALAALALNAFSSELQRAITGKGLDIVEIRPGLATSGLIGGGTSAPTYFAAGKALGDKLFVTANLGFCLMPGQGIVDPRNVGASLEYRFNRALRAQLAAEPIQSCLLRGVDIFGSTKRYQFGADLRWDRDY